ncbi:AlpA family phage regulatory protein [Duganella sp. BJB488]|uniref:helix-turn-helix transcriptional regulator n=1 Tax=unclassified Duganella TaxID=2636909 RepID=UPI000E34B007|nr:MULTISPECIES: AlpA family phage regulatory protein [unclassified Duganella]RFP23175.1 AlpA family phage regulatory protein [Duganella sp. BJB489]RFP24749.1 AlpA family phage regulatory protein [Duganella sp. BJB488]RFP34173.1 AlpA family phage regulatory protein [Duganella sp. BJB480]
MHIKDKFLRLPEVIELTGRSRSSIYADIRAKLFPHPVRIGARATAWTASSIAAWQANCIQSSNRV